MENIPIISNYSMFFLFSIFLNVFLIINTYVGDDWNLSWSIRAAREAESAAAISCSGHGRAYLDGLLLDGKQPVCECNACFSGHDCSVFMRGCIADADSGDPLFLEPFWMQHAERSALVVAGWHRMSYRFQDQSFISKELENHIRKLHFIAGNADTKDRFIVFGAGSTQLLSAAVYALSSNNSSSRARVVASFPFYPLYELQTNYFRSFEFEFDGDAYLWKNNSNSSGTHMIEFVTSPNNPDGRLNKQILNGPYVKSIYDRAYFWPHFTPIPAPADEDLMIFTISKLTGHAGSRWALIKDAGVYQRMLEYISINTMGVSRDTQLRALKVLKVVMEDKGRKIFEFGHNTMKNRWKNLNKIISLSQRFSLQDISPQYCNYFQKIRASSPAYAWVKCEKEEDKDCYEVLKAEKIIGREGRKFGVESRFVRLSLVRSQDDFDLLLHRLNQLISKELSLHIVPKLFMPHAPTEAEVRLISKRAG